MNGITFRKGWLLVGLSILVILISGCEKETASNSAPASNEQTKEQVEVEESIESTPGYDDDLDVNEEGNEELEDIENAEEGETMSDEIPAIYQKMIDAYSQQSPSVQFVSGSVFDITRMYHEEFEEAVRSNDALALYYFYTSAYDYFCNNPESLGLIPEMVNVENDDTDPSKWNADIFDLPGEDKAALCYMPVNDENVEARVFGIILSDDGDGYYYCMIDKDESIPSVVSRNKAMLGIESVGEIDGRGLELMDNFLECIKSDFYKSE